MIYKPQFPYSAHTLSKIYSGKEEPSQKVELFRNETIKSRGFVVNVKDPINFDIDFKLSPENRRKLTKAKTRNYMYDEYINYELSSEKSFGETYRCRIYDVRVNKKELSIIKKLNVFEKVRNHLDDCDGWVVCEIYGIDAFGRLLVDLFFPFETHFETRFDRTFDIKNDTGWTFLNLKDLLIKEKKQVFQIKYR